MVVAKKIKTKFMGQSDKLRAKILQAPDSCGVYLMRDCRCQVLYVGKAKSLRKRLLNYLPGIIDGQANPAGRNLSDKTRALMSKVVDLEFRLTPNEEMALLLESSLIHALSPKYNISLKDDKSFPWVAISREEFPIVYLTRKKKDALAQYFGPYTNAKLLKNALKIIRRSLGYRSCRNLPKQSCIYSRINLCPAPCAGKINSQEYGRIIQNIILILKGKKDLLINRLAKLMQEKSRAHDFEAAARLRDQIMVLNEMFSGSPGFSPQAELEDLKNRLGLEKIPERIEGFDISNFSGKQAVGSMVSFHFGLPDKKNYRRFRIKSFTGIDDYKMLAEVLSRRYNRLLKEEKALPNLLLIDGGKGHLAAALNELEKLKLKIPLLSIAKGKEHVFSSQKSGELNFPQDALAMNLIRRIRDEAHRFAVSYHRLLRKKAFL